MICKVMELDEISKKRRDLRRLVWYIWGFVVCRFVGGRVFRMLGFSC